MKWSERYATGIRHLDEQHKMLFKMSEDYRVTLDEGTRRAFIQLMLESLTAYASDHFGIEQDCMFRYQCPAAEANGKAHLQFIEVLGWFRRRHAESGFNAD